MDSRAQQMGFSNAAGAASPSLEELAAQQGVAPIDDFDALVGKPSPGDESAEEFAANLRGWRREGARPIDLR